MVSPTAVFAALLAGSAWTSTAAAAPPQSPGLVRASTAAVDRVGHLPPAQSFAGEPLAITATVGDVSALGQLILAWRSLGESQWNEVVFERLGDGYRAVIPARAVHRPGVEYTILSRSAEGRTTPHFARPERPHRVYVAGETTVSRERRMLDDYGGHRSAFRVYGGGASFGTIPGQAADWQWDVGASFTYRTLQFLHALQFRFDRIRGQSPVSGDRPGGSSQAPVEAGYTRGGADAHFALGQKAGLLLGTELGVDLDGFAAGGSAGFRIGRPTGTHVWAQYNAVSGVGQTAGLSLHWDTVPRVPMFAAVEATTWPAGQDWATRIRAGFALPLGSQLAVDLEGSYQARSALAGGAGGRGGLTWSF